MMFHKPDRCPSRYRLFKKGAYGTFYIEDALTRRQTSLKNKNKQKADPIIYKQIDPSGLLISRRSNNETVLILYTLEEFPQPLDDGVMTPLTTPQPYLKILGAIFLTLLQPLWAGTVALPRSSPEAQGVSSSALRTFVEAANQRVNTMHSFMLVRHGRVIAEAWWKPESANKKHVMHSLSKSFNSTAIGLAVAEGKLSIDDPVLKFFPEHAPSSPSAKLLAMRVRDLLTMSTGHDTEAKFSTNAPWVETFLAHPVPHKPGAHFLYNTPESHMLSAILRKVTGETVLDYLRPRLFEPLDIEDPLWSTSPQGNTLGGWGLFIRTEDIAKFGQLYLQKGRWNGKQLLPISWIDQATAKQVSNGSDPSKDWDQGYGFQFWRCRHGAYRGDGANGQFCIILPEQDAVIAITANTRDMQAELNVVWDKLLPAFHPKALKPDPSAEAQFKKILLNLEVRPTPSK